MISPGRLYEYFQKSGIGFYTGVPDSLLKPFLQYIQDHAENDRHIIAANEGLAVGLASGYYFATRKIPLVYLQNSGLGNMVNPLTSLADKEMYAVPMLLLIGWRGRPDHKDEPQHVKMGRITRALLQAMEIPCYEVPEDEEPCFNAITKAIGDTFNAQRPVALLARENLFENYESAAEKDEYNLQREDVIGKIIGKLRGDETVVCTTGKIGREFYEQNKQAGNKIAKYFLCAGAMGHANHIALGINIASAEKTVMLDGDGALLMHLGALSTIAHFARNNFIHIVINNGSHESVGGQPTAGFAIDFCGIAKACGYRNVIAISDDKSFSAWLSGELTVPAPCFVEIRTNRDSRKDLGRPVGLPVEWKNKFMDIDNR